ncbi:hypothetical protein ZWY2020_059544 [Hordeum vulgare]|nr:hypothetical protein ZWY2020_059544 [Hordeum vulgare]
MDRNCFNLVVRKIMFDDIQTAQKTKRLIVKHYLDMKFWGICLGAQGAPRGSGRSQGKAPQTELTWFWVGVLPFPPPFFFSFLDFLS